jgi:hypothetical protein
MPTERTIEGRLFPHDVIGPFRLSAQGGKGYQSWPRADLPHLEDYDAVEVGIFSDCPEPIDPSTLGLPTDLAELFPPIGKVSPSLAGNVTRSKLARLRTALAAAATVPGAGLPNGTLCWADRKAYLVVDAAVAAYVATHGLDADACTDGAFGRAIYLSPERPAGAGEPDGMPCIVVELSESPWIFDLRNPAEAKVWGDWNSGAVLEMTPRDLRMQALVDNIERVFDPESNTLAVYEQSVLRVVEVLVPDAPGSAPRR